MKKEEIEEIVKSAIGEAITPIQEEIKKMRGEDVEYDGSKTDDIDIKSVIKAALDDALKPVHEEIESIKKSRNVSKQLENNEPQEDVKKSFWSGLDI